MVLMVPHLESRPSHPCRPRGRNGCRDPHGMDADVGTRHHRCLCRPDLPGRRCRQDRPRDPLAHRDLRLAATAVTFVDAVTAMDTGTAITAVRHGHDSL